METDNSKIHSESQTVVNVSLGNMDRLTQTNLSRLDVESIKEQLEKQLSLNRINSTEVETVNFGSTKIIENDALVLNLSDDIQKIERLQNRINEKRNSNLEYTSPLQVVCSEPNQNEADGVLFYVAIKFKKAFREHLEYDGDTSEADSGMGDSGNSRSGESPQPDEDELESASASQIKMTSDNSSSNESNINTTSSHPSFVWKEGRKKFLQPKIIKTLTSKEKAEKLLQREEIKKRYTILRRETKKGKFRASQNDGLQKVTKPMWFIPGQNSFHVNINPSFSSHATKCYSFQCKPRVRTYK